MQHWRGEVDRFLDTELVVVLLHSIKGFRDRKKAARQVLQHLRALDAQYRRAAEHVVQRDYRLKKLRAEIPDAVTEDFYRRVQEIIDTHT